MIGVGDDVAALDFDLACSLRLLKFDNDTAATNAKLIAIEVGKMLTGTE